jgi:hypothetical protein
MRVAYALLCLAGIIGTGRVTRAQNAVLETPEPQASNDAGPCDAHWSLTGAIRPETRKVDHVQMTYDLPRVPAACRDTIDAQLSSELLRAAREVTSTTTTSVTATCHMSYERSHTMSWRCLFRWRDGGPAGERSVVLGVNAVGGRTGLTFQPSFAGCSAEARRDLVTRAVEKLPARLHEAAAAAAKHQPAILSSYREGNQFHVSFGRALLDDGAQSTVAKLPGDAYTNACTVAE